MTDTTGDDADAIRYAVLRKLASGMRHALMGELQTIQFSAELAVKMLDTGALGPKFAECLKQVPEQTRVAVGTCRSIIEWLRPDDRATATVGEALQQCLRVVGDDWSLRSIEASTDVRTGDARVSKPALRELLVTSLLALTDINPGPLDVAVAAAPAGDEVEVILRASRADRKTPFPPLTLYRALGCDDVTAVAKAYGVACSCARDTVTLRLKTVPATA